jgi:hypothetical protein
VRGKLEISQQISAAGDDLHFGRNGMLGEQSNSIAGIFRGKKFKRSHDLSRRAHL